MTSGGKVLSAAPEALAVLDRGQRTTRAAMQRAVAELHPELARIGAYHLGWCNADGTESPGSGGKAVRPTLALLSAEAASADALVALPGAVAVELVHNFSILHDDVMDGDRMRRHRPTAWTVFGTGPAVLAGDALLALAVKILAKNPGPRYMVAADCLNSAVSELILGQAEDLSFERREQVSIAECLRMSGHKTAALMSCALSIGAILAGAPAATVDALAGTGRNLGLAFQAVDDLLGIWGSEELTGKPVFSDLRQKKKSLPVVAAINAGTPESRELAGILRLENPDQESVAWAAVLVEAAGGRDRARREVDDRLGRALEAIDAIEMPNRTRAELTSLARYLAVRTT
ncbi:MAG TPA: polyprenyl synthetase family protein [Actinomycetota bacterium]|nr:polyprenyl synthetase family protein [Actinomycetota bacterium]